MTSKVKNKKPNNKNNKKKYLIDKKGILQKVASYVIRKHKKMFPHHNKVSILFVWRLFAKKDGNRLIAGETFLLSKRDRDIWGYDFRIEIDKKHWKKLSREGKERLMFHELLHIGIEINDEGKPVYNEDGSLKTYLNPHDIDLETFEIEQRIFGIDENCLNVYRRLSSIYEEEN